MVELSFLGLVFHFAYCIAYSSSLSFVSVAPVELGDAVEQTSIEGLQFTVGLMEEDVVELLERIQADDSESSLKKIQANPP